LRLASVGRETAAVPTIRVRSIAPIALFVASLLLCAACSSSGSKSGSKSTSSDAPTTTVSIAAAAKAYEQAGPNPVGVTTYTLPAGNKVEVWYPAVKGTTGT
jgi:ABC-type glycerol-3-phosphate transport system substrate-binding protein